MKFKRGFVSIANFLPILGRASQTVEEIPLATDTINTTIIKNKAMITRRKNYIHTIIRKITIIASKTINPKN